MVVTFEKDGVDYISGYDLPIPVKNKSFEEIIAEKVHTGSVRDQMTAEFKRLCGKEPSDNTIGWALEEISKKKFYSKVNNIRFHHGKSLHDFNVSWKRN